MNFDDNNPVLSDQSPSGDPALAAETPPAATIDPESALPEDLRAPWGWIDILLLVVIYVFGTIVLSVAIAMIYAYFGISPSQLQNSVRAKSMFVVISQTVLSLGLLGYLAIQMRFSFRLPFWRTIGWRTLETGRIPRGLAYTGLIAGGFLFSIVISLASASFGTKAKLPIEFFFQDRRSALLLMLMAVLIAPVFEETIFRGYLYPVLARRFGVGAGVVITGTLFGLLHSFQLWGGWGQIALLIVVGIVFTYVRAKTRTVVASYLLHVSYNSFLLFAFVVASSGFRHLPPGR